MKYIAQTYRLIPGLLLLLLVLRADAGELTDLGKPMGWTTSRAVGVSTNGLVVVGYGRNGSYDESFRWTAAGGIIGLGIPSGWQNTYTSGVSADGSTIVGYASSGFYAFDTQAFRWTQASGFIGLGVLAGWANSEANAVNADGSVVAGRGYRYGSGYYEPLRWTQATGFIPLGLPAGWTRYAHATAVNADGSVVAGYGWNSSASRNEAFRWTQAGGSIALGLPAGWVGPNAYSNVAGVSADGNVLVGGGHSGSASEAYRWTTSSGFTVLIRPTGWTSPAVTAVSADGSTVIGSTYVNEGGRFAYRWKDGTMQLVSDWTGGVSGWVLTGATGVNADGSVVVGFGTHTVNGVTATEAWLARAGALVSLADLSSSLSAPGVIPQMMAVIPNLAVNGLHHRPLQMQGELEKQAWALGDFGRHNSHDATLAVGEVGGSFSLFKGQLDVGLGIGTGAVWQDLPFGGGSDVEGKHVYLELGHRATDSPFVTTLSGMWGGYDAVVRRGYEVSGSRDASTGRPDVTAGSLRLRFDWLDAWKSGGFTFTPKAEYTTARSTVDAYTETGGGFPASFNEQDHVSHETRLGVTAEKVLSEQLRLRVLAEWAHRYDDQMATVSGEVTGLFPFALDGAQVKSDWLRAGLELERKLGARSSAVVSFHATTPGEDPTYWMNVGLQWKF